HVDLRRLFGVVVEPQERRDSLQLFRHGSLLLVIADLKRRPRPAGGFGRQLQESVRGDRIEVALSARAADLGRNVADHDGGALRLDGRGRRALLEPAALAPGAEGVVGYAGPRGPTRAWRPAAKRA